MYDQFQDRLVELYNSDTASADDKLFIKQTLQRWRHGISPGPKVLKRLNEINTGCDDCSHLTHAGACGWIRKYGAGHGLRVPPVGEPAKCQFPKCQNKCPGYRK